MTKSNAKKSTVRTDITTGEIQGKTFVVGEPPIPSKQAAGDLIEETSPTTPKNIRAIIYLRVSTDEQAESGRGLASQIRACLKYVQEKGYVLVGGRFLDSRTGLEVVQTDGIWKFANPEKASQSGIGENAIDPIPGYQDDFTGTVPIEQRPMGREVYALLRENEADALVSLSMDRLVRPPEEGDEWDMPILIRSLAKLEKEIHTTNRGRLGTSFAELLIAMLDAKSAGDEIRKIVERTTNGRNDKAREGKVGINSATPYGVRKIGLRNESRWEWDTATIEVVRWIFDWFYKHNMSLHTIAQNLESRGVQPPKTNRSGNSRWHGATVRYILNNEIWKGIFYWGKTRVVNGRQVKQPREKWIAIAVPHLAIVSAEEFAIIQERIRQNALLASKNGKWDYILSGFSHCGCCGKPVSGRAGKRPPYKSHQKPYRWYHYKCSSAVAAPDKRCDHHTLCYSGRTANDVVWKWVEGLLSDETVLENGIAAMGTKREGETEPIENRLVLIVENLHETKGTIDRLTARIAIEKDDDIRGSFEHQLDQVRTQRGWLQKEKERLESQLQKDCVTPELKDRIRATAAEIRSRLSSPLSAKHKKQLFRDLRLNVIFQYNECSGEKYLDVSCEIHPQVKHLPLVNAKNGSTGKIGLQCSISSSSASRVFSLTSARRWCTRSCPFS